jgi:hypothetical protein
MRLTVKPENPLEAIALQTRKELHPFLLTMLGMGVSQAVVTAVRLEVFDALQEKSQTATDLAKAKGYDLHGMQVLLETSRRSLSTHPSFCLLPHSFGWIDSGLSALRWGHQSPNGITGGRHSYWHCS